MSEQTQVQHIDPFAGDCRAVVVTKPVDISQLHKEIAGQVQDDVQIVLSVDSQDHVISEAAPAMLFVHPKSLNAGLVNGLIEAHVPAEVVPPASLKDQLGADLFAKLTSGGTLTIAEISNVLMALVK